MWIKRLIAVVAVVAVLAAGLGLAGALWIGPMVAYDAVEGGSYSAVGDRGSRVDAGPFGSYVAKRYIGGGRTTAALSIENAGDRDVEVVELGDTEARATVTLEGVRIAAAPSGARPVRARPQRYVAFEPFDLAPGEQRALQMRFRLGGCERLEPGETVSVSTLLVRYRTGFAERGENIELRSPIEFRRTEDCAPARRARGSG